MKIKKKHFCGVLSKKDIGFEVSVAGWVKRRRDHGGLIFVDLADRSGLVQLVFDPAVDKEVHSLAHSLRDGWVIAAEGKVFLRPPESVNPKIPTGEIEIKVERVDVLNTSLPLPFSVEDETDVNEEVRLKYRYIDLRRPVMQKNIQLRYRVAKATRDFLDKRGFIEVETPFLTRSTPEGARDYLVPSRVNPGEFYALPQSPQLFKQMIMVAGFERYFQIVRCFRDEDLRADRQPEHTQIDIELSFVDEEDIFELIEGMLKYIFESTKGITIPVPFPRLSYQEAIERYGSDKPDIRFGMEIKDFSFLGEEGKFRVFQEIVKRGGCIKGILLSGGSSLSRRELDELKLWVVNHGASDLSWFVFKEKVTSPLVKFYPQSTIDRLVKVSGAKDGDTLFLTAGEKDVVCRALGELRIYLAKKFELIPRGKYSFLWVVDFPLFEKDEMGNLSSVHHPFTSPREEDIPLLETNPERVKAKAYDIVLNGEEIGGGSIRIHKRELQERIFELLGISKVEAREKFGFLLNALSLGAPPHGGIAMGLDRLVMIIAGEKSIREVIPFPKTQKAICLLTQAPSRVDEEQLKELHIKLDLE
ncbi:aspartate--tRNA ligase [Candidatus Aerophobetes bacterium]|nr:aspartate--tRNA ligase [Candidatus Aerophobetes bacterium]